MVRIGLLLVLLGGVPLAGGVAQDSTAAQDRAAARPDTSLGWQEDAWTTIVTRNGVTVSYIFYPEADNQNNGVVLRLQNRNAHPIRYQFTILFRGPEGSKSAEAEGRMAGESMKVGDKDELFWIPFTDGRRLAEVGLRGLRITRSPDAESTDRPR